ncbi:putative PIN and TRAM-domain containing protein YacL [Thermoflexales bacterium]|nr:putative PIN and TRAM-domain containing protein YacL [Thermoflexales bacterium]
MMSMDFIFRLIGMMLFGLGGFYLGQALVATGGISPNDGVVAIVVTILASGFIGLVITPFLTTRPYRTLQQRIKQTPATDLVAAITGLVLGLLIAVLLSFPLSFLPSPLREVLPIVAAAVLGLLGMSTLMGRRRDFAQLLSGRLPLRTPESAAGLDERSVLLDTSVIIDGRIADISRTGFLSGVMLVPRFVLNELQHIADSSDALRRNRGRRGLDILNRMQKDTARPLRITDMDVDEIREVDDKLIALAKRLKCPVLTNDYNLNRVAEIQGVTVLNVNELANAVRLVFLPGESMRIEIIQEGKEVGQGVGYLDDGTMIVVEEGRRYIGTTLNVIVTKVLQTAAGRMIFARPDLTSGN